MSQFSKLGLTESDIKILTEQRYTIGHKIGEGSYAAVHLANYVDDRGRQLKLACKIVNMSKAPHDFVTKFFPRELKIIAKLEHPHIIQTHSIVQRRQLVFVFMAYATNGDLLMHITKHGAIDEDQCKLWLQQLASALKYLHSEDIAHRDLKCDNVLISRHFNVKLTDFGFARYCGMAKGAPVLSDTYCGSTAYAAPEILVGLPYEPKIADAWSLGIILFIMLNGKMPFDDKNQPQMLADQRAKRYAFTRRREFSADAKATVAVLLEPNVQARWNVQEILSCNWILDLRVRASESH
ncbi:CG14305 [Drosophila busckii]|uniref:CG14305 n=1 Tax=Drosophila busckii TaxID=30019 RepID=A0A0M4EQ10_DROBS|nr:testis-specific serine/threonine-protein kinase 1 [Drosophila busckii]ALC46310.1 CG14305 [Drosophila busckii]